MANPNFEECKNILYVCDGIELLLYELDNASSCSGLDDDQSDNDELVITQSDWAIYGYNQKVKFEKGDKSETTCTFVWFVITFHGWYWTLADHLHQNSSYNWMEISKTKVIGGPFDDYKLVDDSLIRAIKELDKMSMEYIFR